MTLTHTHKLTAFLPFSGGRGVRFLLLTLLLIAAFLPLSGGRGVAEDLPTLARLEFWVPPERMAEFEQAYEEKVMPILTRHGWVASTETTPLKSWPWIVIWCIQRSQRLSR